MADYATPNLPARDLEATSRFYARLGFAEDFRDEAWMILSRGDVVIEFFPDPEVDPLASGYCCCVRLDDLDGFYSHARAAGLPEATRGQPRLHQPERRSGGIRIAALVDPDGTLLRLVQN